MTLTVAKLQEMYDRMEDAKKTMPSLTLSDWLEYLHNGPHTLADMFKTYPGMREGR